MLPVSFRGPGKPLSLSSYVILSTGNLLLGVTGTRPGSFFGVVPLPRIPVTTRSIIFLVGDPYKSGILGGGTTQDVLMKIITWGEWWVYTQIVYYPSLPKSSKYLVSRCLEPLRRCLGVQTPTHKVFGRLGLAIKQSNLTVLIA